MDGQQLTAGDAPEPVPDSGPVPVAAPETAARKAGKPKKERRPALLDRFPKLFWRPNVDADWPRDWNVLNEQDKTEYAQLAEDLAVWNDQVKPVFRRLDHRAQ